jgi:hypothetical protein
VTIYCPEYHPGTFDYICDWGLTSAKNLATYGKINPTNGVDQPLSAFAETRGDST